MRQFRHAVGDFARADHAIGEAGGRRLQTELLASGAELGEARVQLLLGAPHDWDLAATRSPSGRQALIDYWSCSE